MKLKKKIVDLAPYSPYYVFGVEFENGKQISISYHIHCSGFVLDECKRIIIFGLRIIDFDISITFPFWKYRDTKYEERMKCQSKS